MNHLANMITEEAKMVKIAAIIVDEATGVEDEVIIADEEDVAEADEDEVELYKMDIWEKTVMRISEIAEQVSYYYIFLGRVRLFWVPTVPCSVFITIRNHHNHHRRMQFQNLFDNRRLIF